MNKKILNVMKTTNETANTGNWIKLSRCILDWEWYDDANTFRVFIDLLLNAQYEDTRYRGCEIKRGQLTTSQDAIAKRLGLSRQQIRTSLAKLEKTGEINQQNNQHFTLITICNYDTYQGNSESSNQQVNQQVTNNQPTDNHLQEVNKLINEEFSTTTNIAKEENFVQEENTDYFSLREVISRVQSFTNDKLDEAATSFIKTKFFMIRNNSFTKKSGEIWDLLSFTNWLMKLLSEQGYSFNTKLSVPNIADAQVYNPEPVQDPFTKEELLKHISSERQEVIDIMLQKFDSFKKNNWKTSKGNTIDLTFFTGYLLNQTKEALGVSKLPDYSKMDSNYLKNFWNH